MGIFNTQEYSVIDPIKPQLDPEIIQNGKLAPEIREKILKATEKIEQIIGISINKILLIGSSLGFQYKDDSDLDITCLINKTQEEAKALNEKYWEQFNEKIFIDKHPMNFFFAHDFFKFKADAIYDVKNDKWIKKPQHISEQEVVDLIKQCKNVKEFNDIMAEYTKLKELCENFNNTQPALREIVAHAVKVSDMFENIRQIRRKDFDKREHGNIPSANFRPSNIVFKLLEHFGLNDVFRRVSEMLKQRFDNQRNGNGK